MGKEFHNEVPRPPGSRYYKPPRDVKREFAKRLSQRIREANLNQSDLARKASTFLPKDSPVTRDLVSNYVRGHHVPRPATLAALAKALGCEPHDLLPPGSVPSADASTDPKLEMKSLENGAVWLRINAVLPFQIATKIIGMVNDES